MTPVVMESPLHPTTTTSIYIYIGGGLVQVSCFEPKKSCISTFKYIVFYLILDKAFFICFVVLSIQQEWRPSTNHLTYVQCSMLAFQSFFFKFHSQNRIHQRAIRAFYWKKINNLDSLLTKSCTINHLHEQFCSYCGTTIAISIEIHMVSTRS